MKIIRNVDHYIEKEEIVATIGNFDGIHLGHLSLLEKLTNIAKINNYKSLVITFEPHTAVFFKNLPINYRITSLKSKMQFIKNLRIDLLLIQNFNHKIATMDPEIFIKNLLSKFKIKNLVVGYDFVFGNNKKGDISILKILAKKYDFKVTQVEKSIKSNFVCSSSNIRALLQDGRVEELSKILGRNYFIIGKVIYGNNLAQRLGYPTANIKLHQLLRPKYGVYLVRVNIDDKLYFGMANIGVRPTLNNIQELLEVHIFNFSDNIYGKIIKVELLRFIREEKKFDSIDLLVAQINNDDSMIKEMCNDYK